MKFKKIIEFESNYLVSECGEVFSLKSKKFLKTFISSDGYEKINIWHRGRQYRKSVHSLVAMAFCKEYYEGKQVNHIDANKLNNHADNLEWVTAKENVTDTLKRGTHISLKTRKPVKQLSLNGDFIREYNSLAEASKFTGICRQNISSACRDKLKTSGKFRWEFV